MLVASRETEVPLPPKPIEYPLSIRKNCYAYVELIVGDLPSMDYIQKNATQAYGNVAVFMYPPTEDFPNGLPHVGVTGKQGYGEFDMKESHYKGNTVSERKVKFNDPYLVGFINI